MYLGSISVMSLLTFIATFMPGFDSSHNRHIRGLMFVALATLCLIPFVHLMFFDIQGAVNYYVIQNKIYGLLCYLAGVIIYVKRFPEFIWPGKFCYLGSSHQIWHFLIVAAIVFHYWASLDAYNSRYDQLDCKSPDIILN